MLWYGWLACSSPTTAPEPPASPPAPKAAPFDMSKPKSGFADKTLCTPEEFMVWACEAGRRLVSICASRDLSPTAGYVQYRIGLPGALELEYPAQRVHPRGHFAVTTFGSGDQNVKFSNGGYDYEVVEILRSGDDGIEVSKDGQKVSRITCNGDTDFYPLSEAVK
jgi:hypothetical protein